MCLRSLAELCCAASVCLVLPGGCRQEAAASRSAVDVPDAEAAPTEAFDRSRFKVRDSVSFVTAGRSYDLIVLSDRLEDSVGAMWCSGVRPVVLYERTSDQRRIVLHNDSIVLAGDQGGMFGDPYDAVEFRADTLRFFHYGGSSWRWGFTLEFVAGRSAEWPLVRRTSVWYHVLEPDSTLETTDVDMRSSGKHLGNWSSYQ
jgi:hypothetical protein